MERETEFDVVVIGAGLAGLCCAGEFVAQGRRPLLICETREVGAVFRVHKLGTNNSAFLQHVTWQQSWGGGWWFDLARRLNIPLQLNHGLDWEVSLVGLDTKLQLKVSPTARAMTDTLCSVLPVPDRAALERILAAALAIPYEELLEMHDVRLSDWLLEQGADDATTFVILTLAGIATELSVEMTREHTSVLGGFGVLRLLMAGEGSLPMIYPSLREGLCMPLADAIDAGGGEVRRRSKVERVLIDNGRVVGVQFVDGSRLECSIVAMATGTPRIAEIIDPVPPEVAAPLDYLRQVDLQDFNQFRLLREPLAPPNMATVLFDPPTMSWQLCTLSITEAAPWTTEPGKQVVLVHISYSKQQIDEIGGPDAVYELMTKTANEMIPGLEEATEDMVQMGNRHHWFAPTCIGPKLPRLSPSVAGLYYVGDGSRPSGGVWTEAAASCGILGARDIMAADIAAAV